MGQKFAMIDNKTRAIDEKDTNDEHNSVVNFSSNDLKSIIAIDWDKYTISQFTPPKFFLFCLVTRKQKHLLSLQFFSL